MSLDLTNPERPIHYPKDPECFQFDEEVAEIFDNIASRSIPLYAHAHTIAARLAWEHIAHVHKENNREIRVLDIGASTGAFFKAMYDAKIRNMIDEEYLVKYYAVDPCAEMLDKILVHAPQTKTYQLDALQVSNIGEQFDVVNMSYVMQFIPIHKRSMVLAEIRSIMRLGGIMLVAQKESLDCSFVEDVLQQEYIQFRIDNGYSREEIVAKTKALANSMWPESREETHKNLCCGGFGNIQELTRSYQFSSLVCEAV